MIAKNIDVAEEEYLKCFIGKLVRQLGKFIAHQLISSGKLVLIVSRLHTSIVLLDWWILVIGDT